MIEASVLKELKAVLQSFADRGVCVESIDPYWHKVLGTSSKLVDLEIKVAACEPKND